MWTRIKHSLTLRIFLMTCGLMIAVCAATYGAIAYLTPLTYTSILQEDLDQKTEALLTAVCVRRVAFRLLQGDGRSAPSVRRIWANSVRYDFV